MAGSHTPMSTPSCTSSTQHKEPAHAAPSPPSFAAPPARDIRAHIAAAPPPPPIDMVRYIPSPSDAAAPPPNGREHPREGKPDVAMFGMSAQLTMSLAPHILQFQTSLLNRVTASTPLLTRIAQYYILQPSKRIRPCLIFLIAQATNGLGAEWPAKLQASGVDETQCPHETVLPSQVSLAEVIEMIHVASLLHDDVLDDAPLRRGAPSAPAAFGNKRAILGGDFLLGRAMALCASLGTPAVMSVVADALCALVDGELIQAEAEEPARGAPPADGGAGSEARPAYLNGGDQSKEVVGLWEDYLKKTYMKTASLFSQALQAAVMLGGAASADPWREVAATYGSELGMAFQIIDDLLDFKGDQKELGKAANAADLKLGLVTAPAFFALEEDERMLPLILRRFEGPGDVEKALEIVLSTQALERTRELAQAYATRAYECLEPLPPSPAKVALQTMTEVVMARQR